MNKIPVPVIAGVIVVAIALLGFAIFRSQNNAAGDTGNIKQLAGDIVRSNPKDAPKLPPGINPTAGAMSMGPKKH